MLSHLLLLALTCIGAVFGYLANELRRNRLDERERPKTWDDARVKLLAPRGSRDRCCALDCAEDNGGKVSRVYSDGNICITVSQ